MRFLEIILHRDSREVAISSIVTADSSNIVTADRHCQNRDQYMKIHL
jgi:hypothetical protein